jgi:2-polyprenyl-6-methoxyphenol hydroxylase-like FAD-dependent oxidoreductase
MSAYDVIVVGARCAGAATAFLLARSGRRVLLVDQASFPSDKRLSTHLIWHAGVDLLSQWGLLDAVVATGAPLLPSFKLDMGELVLRGQPPATVAGAALAPRRHALDQVLLQAAVDAGVDWREGVSVDGLLRQADGRVCGIDARLADGSAWQATARLVVGADGSQSRVADAVQAPVYEACGKALGSFNMYAYFRGLSLPEVGFYARPERMYYAWATNDSQTLVGVIQPAGAPRPARAEMHTHVLAELQAQVPELGQAVAQAERCEDWMAGAIGSFCRQPAGPGWALVGDAGLTVDPITAAGITLALRDADTLSGLVHIGLDGDEATLDAALARFQGLRDAVSVPLKAFAQDMARLAPPPEEVAALFGAMATQPAVVDDYYGLFGQTVMPADFFSPDHVGRIMAGGNPSVAQKAASQANAQALSA